jgi:hypothetical protein
MTYRITVFATLALLAGCAQLQQTAPEVQPQESPAPPAQEEAEERPVDQSPATGDLGTTVASLGSAKEPGLWLKTPLVDAPGRGRVTYPETGQSVAVDLMPRAASRGAGSQLSVEAFQALGAPLTGLPELRVTGLGA